MTDVGRWMGGLGVVTCLAISFSSSAHPVRAGTTAVPHRHVCENRVIVVREFETILSHRRDLSPSEVADRNAMMDAWARTATTSTTAVVRRSQPTNKVNCHGKTFGGGDGWMNDPSAFVRRCRVVPANQAKVGDVVVWRRRGQITHSARVIGVQGGKITVHSQLGNLGDYDHDLRVTLQGEVVTYEHPRGRRRRVRVATYGTPTIYRCP